MTKILTYNIFGSDARPKNCFTQRLEPLRQVILELAPDIICLQEASPRQVEYLLAGGGGGRGGRDASSYEVCYDLTEALQTDLQKVYTAEEEEFLRVYGTMVILLRKDAAGWDVLEKRLVLEGDFIDTGIICVKLRNKNNNKFLYLYNNHFTGGTYGLEEKELNRRRQFRIDQYKMLQKDIKSVIEKETATTSDVSFLLTGDFNSDAEKLDEFPEASNALELALPPGNDVVSYGFVDLWNVLRHDDNDGSGGGGGATESTSRNKFRAYLKPKQQREVRFDRILLGRPSGKDGIRINKDHGFIHIVGDKPVSQADDVAKDEEGSVIPLFPSDHFGVCAALDDDAIAA